MTTEVRSTTTRGHTKTRESTTQKATQILGTPVHLWMSVLQRQQERRKENDAVKLRER